MAQTSKTSERVEITREYEVTDAPPLQLRYRKSQIIPQRLVVAFRDGELARIAISGGRLRPDGTAGDRGLTEDYSARFELDELPGWAVPLTEYQEG